MYNCNGITILEVKERYSVISIYFLSSEKLKSSDFSLLVDSLPFGDTEKNRLLAIGSSTYKWESLGGLTALSKLSKILDIPLPTDVLRTPSGKPYFENGVRAFGISHSHGICAAALADGAHSEIGFDIEVINEKYNCKQISQRFFSPEEKLRFDLCGETPDAFFAIWTAKEARSKLDGKGLSTLISAKEASGDVPIYLSQLTVSIDGKKVAVSVCSYSPDEPIKIYFDRD